MPRKFELKVYKDDAETRLREFVASRDKYKNRVPLDELLVFLKRLESEFGDDYELMASAFVNLIKSYYLVANVPEVAAVGARLFLDNAQILQKFADFIGLTLEEVLATQNNEIRHHRRRRRSAVPASTTGTPVESSADEAGSDDEDDHISKFSRGTLSGHKRNGTHDDDDDYYDDDDYDVIRLPECQWRLDGDNIGSYFIAGDQLWGLARIEAWRVPTNEQKQYRGRFLLGPQMGQLLTLAETQIEAMGGYSRNIANILRRLDLPLNWIESIQPAAKNVVEYGQLVDAHRILSLEQLIKQNGPEWANLFGALVWAQSRSNEPPWPSIVVDPKTISENNIKLQEQAIKAVKAQKHMVQFLGFPEHKGLGFVQASIIRPYNDAQIRATIFPLDQNAIFKRMKRSFKIAYQAGINTAESLEKSESSHPNQDAFAHDDHVSEDDSDDDDDFDDDDESMHDNTQQDLFSEGKEQQPTTMKMNARQRHRMNAQKQQTNAPMDDINDQSGYMPGPGDLIEVVYDDDPVTYLCTVIRDENTNRLLVSCNDFPRDEPNTCPFDPRKDEWHLLASAQDKPLFPPIHHKMTCSIQVRWWQTEDKSGDRLTEKVPIELSEQIEIGDTIASIEIDGSKEYQRILGFGGAFTQAAASVWQKLDKKKQEDLIAAYFDPERGIGYTFGRVPINSCDFSPDTYSFDNVPGDYALNFFDELVQVDADRIIPMIQAAFKFTQKLKILASPWSPPAWMKSNNNMLKGGKVNKTDDMDVWARYIMKWISAYQNYEIPIWGLTVQNEPESAQAWESCEYKPHEQAVFVDEFLGPYLTVNHPHVSLFGFDHNKNHLYKWAETLFTNTSYFDGIAFHWYAGACFTQIQRVAHDFPDKILLPSEACYELAQIPKEFFNPDTFLHHGNWARGEGYADDILKDLHAGSHGWIDWNLILDETGGPNHVGNLCDAPVLADVKFGQGDLYFHPQYFYLGHFSKFILPQSIRLGLNIQANASLTKLDHFDDCMGWPVYGACHPGSLKSVAFRRPDGQIALVVMNCNDHALDFRLSYKGLGSFKNIIPAHAIQTYLIPDLSTLFLPPPFNFLTLSTRSRLRALFSNSFSSLLFGIIFIISLSTFIYKGREHRGSRRQPHIAPQYSVVETELGPA